MGGVATALALPFATVDSAHAIILTENLSQNNIDGWAIDNSQMIGSSFTTDNNSYTLNFVTARLQEFAEAPITIDLYSNNSGAPGTVIDGLTTTDDIASGSYNNYDFTPSSSVSLDPNTTYWLIGSSSSGGYAWSHTDSINQTGLGTIGDGTAYSDDGGSSFTTDNEDPVQFAVDADVASAAVPFEFSPTMGILLIGGLFGGKTAYGKYRASKVKLEA